MMVWLIVIVAILLFMLLPVGFWISCDIEGMRIALKIGPAQVLLYPQRRTNKSEYRKQEDRCETTKRPTGKKRGDPDRNISDFFPVLRLVFEFLKDFRRKLRINVVDLKLIIGGSDPCDVAVNYGRASSAVSGLMALLDQFFIIKYHCIHYNCDFLSSKTVLWGKIEFTITIGRILHLLGYHGIRILLSYLKVANKRKDGAKA